MVSRLVLSLRKAADQKIDVTDFISEQLSFNPNPRLPVHTHTQLEFAHFLHSRTSVSSEARYDQTVIWILQRVLLLSF